MLIKTFKKNEKNNKLKTTHILTKVFLNISYFINKFINIMIYH